MNLKINNICICRCLRTIKANPFKNLKYIQCCTYIHIRVYTNIYAYYIYIESIFALTYFVGSLQSSNLASGKGTRNHHNSLTAAKSAEQIER